MARIELNIGSESPELQVKSIAGSLQVKGWGEESIRIEVHHEDDLTYSFEDNVLSLSSASDCILRVPNESELHVVSVSGDALVTSIEGDIHVEKVGGSLTLKSVGPTQLGEIYGNLTARGVEGELNIDEVMGNASLRDIEGDLEAKEVHANLSLRDIEGDVKAKSAGNADLRIETENGNDWSIEAGGNLFCTMEPPGDAEVSFESGAESIHISTQEGKHLVKASEHSITLGDESSSIELKAGGHIDFRCQEGKSFSLDLDLDIVDDAADLADEISEQVSSQVETQLESLNEQLEALAERLKHSGNRATLQAQRRVEAAQRKLQGKLHGRHLHGVIVKGKSAGPVSEKERMLILQMVQEKKISVMQAEMLLNTLEGRAPVPAAPTPPTPPVAPTPPEPPVAPTPPERPTKPGE